MPGLQHAVICVIAFMLSTTMTQGQGEIPVKISPVIIVPGTSGECPSDDSRQESRSFLRNATCEIIQNLNTPVDPISQICGSGNWRRVFYLNASRSDQTCPGQWSLLTSPVRGCTGSRGGSCRSAFSDKIGTTYGKVCGRIIGEGVGSPDAFHRSPLTSTIEGNYLDGVSITHGAPGSRTHIWTLGAGHPGARCPCDTSNRDIAPLPPVEVGDNYFCDRADGLDPLWTGESCASDNPCCSFNNPPYFSTQLTSPTTDRIELRICTDQVQGDETVLVLFAEMYVQ